MAKTLAGVKYGKLTSAPKLPPHTKGAAKGGGRAGPPMVDIGSKSSASSNLKARPNTKFARLGSVSERSSRNTGGSSPVIGSQSNRKGGVGPYK